MRVTTIFLLFTAGLFCTLGNAELDYSDSSEEEEVKVTLPDCEKYNLPACSKKVDFVCGTDGRTYDNECLLCLESQKKKVKIGILNRGKC
ncbi:serine protease inhibitor Kazal-type 1-like [Eublepharis macularius]|uniref:Serine protease inhibitor Kazal-type 1-like n=1 Tax=Eublepharis macularius TaxID=481883 RepID=A0AA97J4H3_EUBMA|nr:serine protease inhibitor Kazal-type 1-like [Eublepharis macularius]